MTKFCLEDSENKKLQFTIFYKKVTKKPSRLSKLAGMSLKECYILTKKLENNEDIF